MNYKPSKFYFALAGYVVGCLYTALTGPLFFSPMTRGLLWFGGAIAAVILSLAGEIFIENRKN